MNSQSEIMILSDQELRAGGVAILAREVERGDAQAVLPGEIDVGPALQEATASQLREHYKKAPEHLRKLVESVLTPR